MTLRNVPESFTLEQQRLEINELAVDLDTAVDGVQTFSGNKTFTGSYINFPDPSQITAYDLAVSIILVSLVLLIFYQDFLLPEIYP